uniref:Uncharacterized protein n=1 Tax=Setaria italica TaxID=4555 RepID=K4AGP5_SETIT
MYRSEKGNMSIQLVGAAALRISPPSTAPSGDAARSSSFSTAGCRASLFAIPAARCRPFLTRMACEPCHPPSRGSSDGSPPPRGPAMATAGKGGLARGNAIGRLVLPSPHNRRRKGSHRTQPSG